MARAQPRPRGSSSMTVAAAKKILLVDDDGALRRSLAEHLRLHEEFITVEVDAGRALALAAKLKIKRHRVS